MITIEDFANIELKTGKVLEAQRVEKSNKLIVLKVDVGEERQIVAGIGKAYTPEELIGKSIVVVTNMQPATLMGVEAHGMLLLFKSGVTTHSPRPYTSAAYDHSCRSLPLC